MVKINENYLKLQSRYLFSEIGKRTREFIAKNPNAPVIKLGIGDTTLPLPKSIITALHKGTEEMSIKESYKGYGPEQGYEFLRQAIAINDFKSRGVEIDPDEIFISDGSKCDTGNILDIFGKNVIAISDPAYPVYVDTNVMIGNTGKGIENGEYEGIVYLKSNESTGFKPKLPDTHVDLIYLCSPNNPTGTSLTFDDLKQWVEYAKKEKSIILFDAAYEAFIEDEDIPHSIFEIKGADECAIEFRSFSKTAGFTGVRCAFTVIPKKLMGYDEKGKSFDIHSLWNRRHSTKFNGVSYPVQVAAAAVYSEEGKKEIKEVLNYYKQNATTIMDGLKAVGIKFFGGVNSPYIWLKTPNNLSSWDFFDLMLNKLNIVGTPGSGFGQSGEGYFRLTAFGDQAKTKEAMERIKSHKWY
jgi:LL-diaminopimelate aminotransferase